MESHLDKNDSSQDEGDPERNEIRSELSKMSFEDLQKLKEKLGQKVYSEAMHGVKSVKQTTFKRENKNRPREVSSKIRPETVKKKVKEKRIADPRFDRLCGTFNRKFFQNSYEFISDIKKKEKVQLQKQLKKEEDPENVDKIKYLIQRMDNQEREENRRQKQIEAKEKEREEQIKALESGQKPYFRTKYEKKIVQLVDKYSDLKKSGKVQKYLERKQKKRKAKKKRKRYFHYKVPDNEGEQITKIS